MVEESNNPTESSAQADTAKSSQDKGRQSRAQSKAAQQARFRQRLNSQLLSSRRRKQVAGKMMFGKKKALAAVTGFFPENNFTYTIAMIIAMVDDFSDLFSLSFPILDLFTASILWIFVYPRIPTNFRIFSYFLSGLDFIPGIGFLPMWTLTTAIAWASYRKRQQEGLAA